MKIKQSIITVLLSLLCSASGYSQEGRVFKDAISALIQRNEPTWSLEHNESFDLQQSADYDAVYGSWKTPNGHADLLVFVFVSIDQAKSSYPSAFVHCIDAGDCVDKVPLNTKVTNLGEENRMWYAPKVGITGIVFRKDRFVSQVSASSPEIAQKLALMIAEEMKLKSERKS